MVIETDLCLLGTHAANERRQKRLKERHTDHADAGPTVSPKAKSCQCYSNTA